jgi:hypothetical protein
MSLSMFHGMYVFRNEKAGTQQVIKQVLQNVSNAKKIDVTLFCKCPAYNVVLNNKLHVEYHHSGFIFSKRGFFPFFESERYSSESHSQLFYFYKICFSQVNDVLFTKYSFFSLYRTFTATSYSFSVGFKEKNYNKLEIFPS